MSTNLDMADQEFGFLMTWSVFKNLTEMRAGISVLVFRIT